MKLNDFFVISKRKLLVLGVDISCFSFLTLLYYLATCIPESTVPFSDTTKFLTISALLLISTVIIRSLLGVYQSVWRYTNTMAYAKLVVSDFLAGVFTIVLTLLCGLYEGILHIAVVAAFNALLTLFSRFTYRLSYKHFNKARSNPEMHKIPVAIVGAGQIGALLAEELTYNKHSNYKPVFFIDRNKAKAGGRVAGLKIYHESENIIEFIKSQAISEIFVAIDGLDNETSTQIYDFYKQTSCKIKI